MEVEAFLCGVVATRPTVGFASLCQVPTVCEVYYRGVFFSLASLNWCNDVYPVSFSSVRAVYYSYGVLVYVLV